MADNEQSKDYLKLIAMVISIFALGISFLSWRESHRNTCLNEAINRPQLNVTQLSARSEGKQKDFTDIEILIRVKNIGKVSEKVERSTIETYISRPVN